MTTNTTTPTPVSSAASERILNKLQENWEKYVADATAETNAFIQALDHKGFGHPYGKLATLAERLLPILTSIAIDWRAYEGGVMRAAEWGRCGQLLVVALETGLSEPSALPVARAIALHELCDWLYDALEFFAEASQEHERKLAAFGIRAAAIQLQQLMRCDAAQEV